MLKLKDINLSFGAFSISDINLNLEKGDYFVLLGPSGAGKSVVLELIAGIVKPDSGRLYLNGIDITQKKIQERSIGLVFQDFAIFPHLNVEQNIAYPLKIKKWPKIRIRQRVEELAKQMEIFHLLSRNTISLSGGEKQRVALARTLALSPDVLLLDEPLASLDVQLKKDLRAHLRKLHKLGQTIIHVTHDFEEAILLADKVAIFNQGKIIQQGKKNHVFEHPRFEFVAHFIGIKNYFEVVKIINDKIEVTQGLHFRSTHLNKNQQVYAIMIHSGDVQLSKAEMESSSENNIFSGTIIDIYPAYRGFELLIDIGLQLVVNISQKQLFQLNVAEGDRLNCYIS
ncbi:MAG: ABC transporter ATP-binding protein, partial [Flavobacterium sp.]|nr:ABC transporter ATP-binding protein [Flavobacterium sp.]